jgi:hypothetical protein
MEVFSPFSIQIPLLFVATLFGSYLLGWLFYQPASGIDSLAMRLSLGHIALLVLLAVSYSGIGTMTILLVPLFMFFAYERFNPTSTELNVEVAQTAKYEYVGLVVFAGIFFLLDAIRMDIRLTEGLLYIGNTDISYYGSTGRMMFEMGEETLPSSVGATTNKMVYHFGDMWSSGFYSYFFDVVPYYAYGILYRSVCTTILFTLFFSFFRKTSGFSVSILLSLLALFANHSLLGYFPSFGVDLLSPFFTSWPIYAESSYLILGIAVLVFIKFFQSGKHIEGIIGLLLTAGLHSVFIVPSFIFSVLYVGVRVVFPKMLATTGAPATWLQVGLIAVAGFASYSFVVLDGRSLSMPIETSVDLLYLTAHTFARTALTISLLAPFVAGMIYLLTQDRFRLMTTVATGYSVAGIAGFCLLYAVFQSQNTVKLLNAILSVVLFPIGIFGLVTLINQERGWKRFIGRVSLSLIVFSTALGSFQTSYFEPIYSWANVSGHQEQWTLKTDDVLKLNQVLTKGVYAGYAICDEDVFAGDLIRYNSFVGINGLLNGGHIFRVNAIESDTVTTVEARSWALKTTTVLISQDEKDLKLASSQYIDMLGIQFLIQDRMISGLCFPEEIGFNAIESVETSRFDFQRIVPQ